MGNASDFFRKFQPLFESKEEAKKDDKKTKMDKNLDNYKKGNVRANWADKAERKSANVKETAADFFRKYSDMIAEAEGDEGSECEDGEDEGAEATRAADEKNEREEKAKKAKKSK